jgi:hypothetical protein
LDVLRVTLPAEWIAMRLKITERVIDRLAAPKPIEFETLVATIRRVLAPHK